MTGRSRDRWIKNEEINLSLFIVEGVKTARDKQICVPEIHVEETRSDFDNFIIFVSLSRESDGGGVHKTNPGSLRSWFSSILEFSAFDFLNFSLVRFHQAGIISNYHEAVYSKKQKGGLGGS